MVTVLRPLSTSELLDRTFHLYRNNFLVFLGITALPQLIVLALRLWYSATLTTVGRFSLMSVLVGFASYVAIQISTAATVVAVSNLHLDRGISVGLAFSAAKGSMVRVALISLAVGIAAGIALIFLIVPGVYVWLMWSLVVPITVLEGGGLNVSTTRSKFLTQGSRGRIFVIYLLIFLLMWVVGMIFQVPLGIFAAVMGSHGAVRSIGMISAISSVGTFISTSLVGPLATIALTLIYYDQRVRKEGFDLQLMMSTMQQGAPAAAAAASPNL